MIIYDSDGGGPRMSWSVVPVVSLEFNIQTIGQDESGVWQLKID